MLINTTHCQGDAEAKTVSRRESKKEIMRRGPVDFVFDRLAELPRRRRPIMQDIIRLTDNYYIVATASTTDEVRVLKQGDSFGVFDRSGDIQPAGLGEQ